jgi:hypothetical protein
MPMTSIACVSGSMMKTDLKKPYSQGCVFGSLLDLQLTPLNRLIILEGEFVVIHDGPDLNYPTSMWPIHTPRPDIQEWIEQNIKSPVRMRPTMGLCNMMFETIEEASLFKLFWL